MLRINKYNIKRRNDKERHTEENVNNRLTKKLYVHVEIYILYAKGSTKKTHPSEWKLQAIYLPPIGVGTIYAVTRVERIYSLLLSKFINKK